MTPLQQRMIEDIQLRGLSERTQEAYVRAVRQLAEQYHKSPARITEEELRDYFLYLKNVKHYSRSASTIALCGIKFFYDHTLKRQWSTLTFVRAPRETKLPVVLRVEEVRTILAHLKLLRYRACLRIGNSKALLRRQLASAQQRPPPAATPCLRRTQRAAAAPPERPTARRSTGERGLDRRCRMG